MMRVFIIIPLLMSAADSVPMKNSRNGIEYAEPEYLDSLLAQGDYEEFSRLLGIPSPYLSKPRAENAKGDPSLSLDLFHGDMILTPEQEEQARQAINFTKYTAYKWPNCMVLYSVSSEFSASNQAAIENGISKWNSYNNGVKFVKRTTQKDYCFFFPGDGCYANLGKVGGQQPISLAPNGCFRLGTILHEMMHSCGFMHEQNRPDRDYYVRIIEPNIPKDWLSQYKKGSSDVYGLYGPYDFESVMHYPMGAPGTGKPAFDVLNTTIDKSKIGQRNGCSETDLLKLRAVYKCK